MKCRQAKNLIFDHIDGMISEPDRVALERHLNQCGDCESMASSLSRSLDLLHKLPSVEPSENFNWKVRLRLLKEKNALRDGAETERQWYRAWNTRFAVSAVSALAMVLVAGTVLMKSSIQPGADLRRSNFGRMRWPASRRHKLPRLGHKRRARAPSIRACLQVRPV